ncbi:E3 ubiquitin-protein ligase TRIM38-like isoform X5 [Brienomyrus brachyistius]|uniref:E3 ubiquitin-protein ligase TRIM38-like isoform X5 n=1 Tax=Brienomyrus brachyistius TaxID=42636 RepID=UPI0020B3FD34|nr:E3 ubiquitin-protein ligase TRIM38-like isoform X5 [Brienomyrus brachyistius]
MDGRYTNIEMNFANDHLQKCSMSCEQKTEYSHVGELCTQPGFEPQSTSGRESLYRRTMVVFISLWIITLIILGAVLSVSFLQGSSLQNEMTDLQRMTSSSILEIQAHLEDKNKQLETKNRENSNLIQEKSGLQNQLKDLQMRTSNNISGLQVQLEDKNKQLETKNRENSNLIQEKSGLQNQLKELQMRTSNNISGLQVQLEDKNNQLETKNRENSNLIQEKSGLQNQLKELQMRTSNNISGLQVQLEDKNNQLETKNRENSNLIQEKSGLQNQLKDLQMRTSNNISGLQVQLEDKNKQLETKNRENSNLIQERSGLQNQLKELQMRTSSNISGLQAQLEDKNKQLATKNRENSNLIQQRSDLQNEVQELQTIAEDGFAKWTSKQGIVRQEVWKWIRKAAATVILDPRTAHRNLTVSEDGKQVTFSGGLLPDSPLRFSNWYGIQGKESFSSGRHYYEVQVGTRGCFSVGFVKESVEKMKYTVTSESGFLMFILEKNVYKVSTTPPTSLSLNEPPNNVGVYVDYDKGQVSFYNVGTRSHIYSFTGYNFSEKLYPAVNSCNSMTSGPLIISPVSHTA